MMYFGKIVREFHEMIRMSHVVACPITFILLCDQSRKGEVLRIMKMVNWKYFRSLWSVSSLFWAVPGVDHTICDESNWYSCVKNCFYTFVVDFGQKSPQTYVKWLFFNILAV